MLEINRATGEFQMKARYMKLFSLVCCTTTLAFYIKVIFFLLE
jgi:hypothetical protein